MNRLSFPSFAIKAAYYRLAAKKANLPGRTFDTFGRLCGLSLLLQKKFHPQLLLNPVSCVRYFEFDYCQKNLLPALEGQNILDISSPYLFGFYLCRKNKLTYQYINPDENDLRQIRHLKKYLRFNSEYSTDPVDATSLPYKDSSIDSIISISVIEHVNSRGDTQVMSEMWRVLKPGGRMLLTFPVKKEYEEEYRATNVYHLSVDEKDGAYFFQRYYDRNAIEKRLLSAIDNVKILSCELFGEINEGDFDAYEHRWMKNGLAETIKDPLYISTHMKYYKTIEDIPGMAVMGITLVKLDQ